MNEPKYLYGRMHFEDGVRTAILRRGRLKFNAFFIDADTILKRYVMLKEEKFFKELINSREDLNSIKRKARYMLNKSRASGRRREMTKATRKTLKELLEYETA